MRDLTFDEFVVAWSTYWGRREIGIVVDNAFALSIGARTPSLRTFHEQWRAARAAFPNDAPLWLMGTPDLTPELFSKQSTVTVAPPPTPQVGRYVVENSRGSGLANVAGDYTLDFPRNSAAARTGRRMVRGRLGVMVSVASLAVVWLPFLALPLAILGLVWAAQADVLLRRGHAPWRIRWPTVAGQLVGILSILLTVLLALTPHSPAPTTPREDHAMTRAFEDSLSGDIVARLRAHWPQVDISAEFVDGVPGFVRVRVGDHVFLDAVSGEQNWVARPMKEMSGQIRPAEPSRSYGIGVKTTDGADAIADRFYEEARFWWAKLHSPGIEATA
jgi:hypothetical protein